MWHEWLVRPEHVRARQLMFQLHLWIGAAITAWVLAMSLTGSALVFRNQLTAFTSVEWILKLHTTLLFGPPGTIVNAGGAFALMILCSSGAVIWWPGIDHWRRSLTIDWKGHRPRLYWDVHSALGFWFFGFVSVWAVSGLYLARPHLFDVLYMFDPSGRITDTALFWLSVMHFGRFNVATQIIWTVAGLMPAALAFTGAFICCRRVIFQRSSDPKHTRENAHPTPATVRRIVH